MTMDSLDRLGLDIHVAWEIFEHLPKVEPRLGPEPDEVMYEAIEASVEEDIAPAQKRFVADSSRRILDQAENAIESHHRDRVWSLSDGMLDLVEQDCESKVTRAAMPETEVEPAEDHGWFGPTPNISVDRPPVAGREETFGGPWRLPIGVRPPRTRPIGSSSGLRTIEYIGCIGSTCFCPIYNTASSLEFCQECEFYNEEKNNVQEIIWLRSCLVWL